MNRRVGSLEKRFQSDFCPGKDKTVSKFSKSTDNTNTRPAAITSRDHSIWVTVQYPATIMYMCRCALKNEVYNNSCYSYSNKWQGILQLSHYLKL